MSERPEIVMHGVRETEELLLEVCDEIMVRTADRQLLIITYDVADSVCYQGFPVAEDEDGTRIDRNAGRLSDLPAASWPLTFLGSADPTADIRLAISTRAPAPVDPLATPQHRDPITLPTGEVVYPGDDRFAVRVRTVYGACEEQIVHATSLKQALELALEIPFVEWFEKGGL